MMSKKLRIAATAIAMVAAVSVAANAQSRPDSRTMSCGQVQSLIASSGAIVLTTGRHTYDRFVVGDGYCSRPSVARLTSISTRDGACRVLYCGQPLFDRRW